MLCWGDQAGSGRQDEPAQKLAQTSAVYTHLKSAGHAFSLEDVVVLDREEQWYRWGVKEAIWERVDNPSPNKKGGGGSDTHCRTRGPGQ